MYYVFVKFNGTLNVCSIKLMYRRLFINELSAHLYLIDVSR